MSLIEVILIAPFVIFGSVITLMGLLAAAGSVIQLLLYPFSIPRRLRDWSVSRQSIRERRARPGYRYVSPEEWHEQHYGEFHQTVRARHAARIAKYGAQCMERVCVMPSRQIEAGDFWHLAHDHAAGGAQDYLGPAHPECNEAEARGRGVNWAGVDDLDIDSRDQQSDWSVEEFGFAHAEALVNDKRRASLAESERYKKEIAERSAWVEDPVLDEPAGSTYSLRDDPYF